MRKRSDILIENIVLKSINSHIYRRELIRQLRSGASPYYTEIAEAMLETLETMQRGKIV